MPYIRRLFPTDRAAVAAHFAALTPEDRRLRFGHAAGDAQIAAHLKAIDWSGWLLLGAFQAGRLRGLLELAPLSATVAEAGPARRKAELALTVHRGWRHAGLGTELCRRGLTMACNRRIGEVVMICLSENVQMRRIVARLRGQVLRHPGESEGRVRLPQPSAWSLAQEALFSGAGVAGALTDQWCQAQERGSEERGSEGRGAEERAAAG